MTTAIFVQALLLGIPVGLALGLVGGGGSILTVPILIGVIGLEPKAATSASLVIVAVNAIAALRGYLREQLVQYRMAFTVTATGLLGSIAGTWANHLISPQILTFAFTGLMVLIAVMMLRGPTGEAGSTPRVSISRIILAGTLIGLTTGFFGVGGGFIIVPTLLALGLKMRQAVPTSLLVIALNSLVALGLRMIGGANVPYAYALPMILGGIIGSSLAVRIAPKIGNLGLRRAFAALILGLAAYLGMTAFSR
jgi:uncharacterized protein